MLELWTVYSHPRDFPLGFVARKWILDKPTDVVVFGVTLAEVRSRLPEGLYCLTRSPRDEPHIVETWF